MILSWWLFFIASQFTHWFITYRLIWLWSQNGKGTKELEEPKHLSTKIQEVTSNIVIIEKNEKLCHTTAIPGTQGAFSDKVTPNIDGFTDKPVVQYDVQVVENT